MSPVSKNLSVISRDPSMGYLYATAPSKNHDKNKMIISSKPMPPQSELKPNSPNHLSLHIN